MKVLLLAPHPFYQDRGTPIAAHMVLKVLSGRGDEVDVVTYPEGRDMKYDHVTFHRVRRLPFIRHIRPGFSWKKVLCDILMFFKAARLLLRNRYMLIHAIEESSVMALALNWFFNVPFIYDMDSCLPEQMAETYCWLIPFLWIFRFFESLVVKRAEAVIPVCSSLSQGILKYAPKRVEVLQDISLLDVEGEQKRIDLKQELGISGFIMMYVGNLEVYQGIDLLLESLALVNSARQVDLVIVGGEPEDIQKYRVKSLDLGIRENVHFLGPKPVEQLSAYLRNADILVSPRLKGRNTPMKLYSYLHSGKAVLATNLETHTQVLDNHVAVLADPSPEAFSKGMIRLIDDEGLRVRLGIMAKRMFEENFSYDQFSKKLNGLYDELESEILPKAAKGGPSHIPDEANDILEKESIVH